jgi:hypothetical protein
MSFTSKGKGWSPFTNTSLSDLGSQLVLAHHWFESIEKRVIEHHGCIICDDQLYRARVKLARGVLSEMISWSGVVTVSPRARLSSTFILKSLHHFLINYYVLVTDINMHVLFFKVDRFCESPDESQWHRPPAVPILLNQMMFILFTYIFCVEGD